MNAIVEHRDIQIKGKHGRPILLDVFSPSVGSDFPVVVFSHGFKGFKDWGPFNEVAEYFAAVGFVFVKFNFAFNGTTPDNPAEFADLDAFGNNNFTRELDDLDVLIEWIQSTKHRLPVNRAGISLLGHSRGGAVSILKASEDTRINSLATWGAVADFTAHVSREQINHWKSTGVIYVENSRTGQKMPLYLQLYFDYIKNRDRFNVKKAAASLKIPLLVIHGTNDESVPVADAITIYNQNTSLAKLVQIEGGDHTFGASHPHEKGSLSPMFRDVLKKTGDFFSQLTDNFKE